MRGGWSWWSGIKRPDSLARHQLLSISCPPLTSPPRAINLPESSHHCHYSMPELPDDVSNGQQYLQTRFSYRGETGVVNIPLSAATVRDPDALSKVTARPDCLRVKNSEFPETSASLMNDVWSFIEESRARNAISNAIHGIPPPTPAHSERDLLKSESTPPATNQLSLDAGGCTDNTPTPTEG
jgi:hypothetical protein